ncbi:MULTISPECIES: hypothetical protein [Pseudoalteromonas]|nr:MULTISPECIES: hypothetical protein [Pseudoalteromonas]
MAFLYCLASSINNTNKSLLYIASIMLFSYSMSEVLYMLSNVYLNFTLYDLLTITVLLVVYFKTSSIKNCPAINYIVIGLAFNSLLMLVMYYDLYILENIDEWWLWSVYSIGVNVIDLLMIAVLFINKDFLGLIELKRFIFNRSVLQQNQIDH